MLMLSAQEFLTLLVALVSMAVPWAARQVKTWQLWLVFGVSFVLWLLGALFSLGWYPWASLLDLVVALSAGMLIGRAIPARFWPYFVFLALLSILDVAQIFFTTHFAPTSHLGNTATIQPGEYYSNVYLILPWIIYHMGPGDLLVLVVIGTYWSKQQNNFWLAYAGLALGLLLTYPIWIVYPDMVLPLVPFFFCGWLFGVAFMRSRKQAKSLAV